MIFHPGFTLKSAKNHHKSGISHIPLVVILLIYGLMMEAIGISGFIRKKGDNSNEDLKRD